MLCCQCLNGVTNYDINYIALGITIYYVVDFGGGGKRRVCVTFLKTILDEKFEAQNKCYVILGTGVGVKSLS